MDEKCVCHSRYNHALFDQSTFLCARTQRGILGAKTLLRGRIAESFECGNPREILETDVSANESIWRTSRRQGEAQYYTPHPLPPPLTPHRCLHRLLFLLSPPGFSAFSAIAVVTTSCRLGRFCDPGSFSRKVAHFAPALTSSGVAKIWQMAAPLSLSFYAHFNGDRMLEYHPGRSYLSMKR